MRGWWRILRRATKRFESFHGGRPEGRPSLFLSKIRHEHAISPPDSQAPYNRSDEAVPPGRLDARLSVSLRVADPRRGRAGHEDSGRSGASGYARVFVCQGGEVSGSRVFAGSGAASDAKDRSEEHTSELQS